MPETRLPRHHNGSGMFNYNSEKKDDILLSLDIIDCDKKSLITESIEHQINIIDYLNKYEIEKKTVYKRKTILLQEEPEKEQESEIFLNLLPKTKENKKRKTSKRIIK